MRKSNGCALLFSFTIVFSALAAAKAPFTFDAMMKLSRIDDPQLSPDGKTVAFTVQTVDMANNSKPSAIYTIPVDGGTPQRLTNEGNTNARLKAHPLYFRPQGRLANLVYESRWK
jgi:dipeptidyl aminopeptidase/acylaminoacyl peptidase